jgi:hypothetical protein
VGTAPKADEPPVAHHRLHRVRTIPIIGRTIPLEAQPAPQSASVTRQEQPPPKPDMAQRSRIERAETSDPVCGERGRRWFTDRLPVINRNGVHLASMPGVSVPNPKFSRVEMVPGSGCLELQSPG